jgi:hypothetical protein
VSAAELKSPAPRASARSAGQLEWRRRLATLRIFQRALGQCFAARVGLWLARGAGITFVLAALYTASFASQALDAVLRLALLFLSACAGLCALSAAGPGPERILESGRGLLENRGVSLSQLQAGRPLAVALWIARQIGLVVLVVAVACVAVTPEPHELVRGLALTAGALCYVLLLAGGLALLAQLCHTLGRTRGQALFWGLIFVPQMLSPAWPDLPRVSASYSQLLDRCLGLEHQG